MFCCADLFHIHDIDDSRGAILPFDQEVNYVNSEARSEWEPCVRPFIPF